MVLKNKKILVIGGIIGFSIAAIAAFIFLAQPQGKDGGKTTEEPEKTADTKAGLKMDDKAEEDIDATAEETDQTKTDPWVLGEKPAENAVEDSDELSATQVAQKTIDYINNNMLDEGSTATTDYRVTNVGKVYKFAITVDNASYDVYATADGKLMFPQAVEMSGFNKNAPVQEDEVAKTARPEVKIFVMSYCPYGLQAQKMYLPVYNLLKDKADMGIYFVNYIMHGKKEIDENLRQYCIQKEQVSLYPAYLSCFTAGPTGEGGVVDYSSCLTRAGIDTAKLGTCVAAADKEFGVTADYNNKETWLSGNYPRFSVNDADNEKYDVQGSPTIIINGKEADLDSRSPKSLLKAVCDTFINVPAECNTVLSDEAPVSGFGSGVTSGGSSGGCGG